MNHDEGGVRRALQCNVCGRWVNCSAEQLLNYTRSQWPRCCERVMALLMDTARQAAQEDPRPGGIPT